MVVLAEIGHYTCRQDCRIQRGTVEIAIRELKVADYMRASYRLDSLGSWCVKRGKV